MEDPKKINVCLNGEIIYITEVRARELVDELKTTLSLRDERAARYDQLRTIKRLMQRGHRVEAIKALRNYYVRAAPNTQPMGLLQAKEILDVLLCE